MRRSLLAVSLVLTMSSSSAYATTISLSVGLPEEIALMVGVQTPIAAAIINTGNEAINFGCACDGIQPFAPFGSAYGLYLSMVEGPGGGSSYRNQFVGLVLNPDERFDFTIFTFTLTSDPLIPMPIMAAFAIGLIDPPFFQPVVTGGDVTAISALTFKEYQTEGDFPDVPTFPVPDHGSALWLASAVCAGLARRHGKHERTENEKG